MAKIIEFKSKEQKKQEELNELFKETEEAFDGVDADCRRFEMKYKNGKKINEDDVLELFSSLRDARELIHEEDQILKSMGK